MTALATLLAVAGLLLPVGTPPPPAPESVPGRPIAGPVAVLEQAEPDPVGVWPLQPRPAVVRGFEPPSGPYGPGHRGVDLLGAVGEPVHTALAGTVTFAGPLAGVGVVVVDHGPTRTTYQPVLAAVPVGTPVPQGAVIGTLAGAGSHCPPAVCLHWGWIRNADATHAEAYLDPLGLVGAVPMRLLPLVGPG